MRQVRRPERAEVAEAAERISAFLEPTPLVAAPGLGPGVLLKVETGQPTGSFKVRGALAALSRFESGTRVVTASAGNHALGVAYAASRLDLAATVVCAKTASPAKIAALRRFPVDLVLHGETYDEAEEHALRLASEGRRYVSAYNDPDVIAGGGSVAVEVLEAVDGPLTVICPVGGGGLVAGVALWVSQRAEARVVGVESQSSPTMRAALDAGRIVRLQEQPTLADGLGGNLEPGAVTFDLVRAHVDDVVLVAEREIEHAIRRLYHEHGLVAEGAGAIAVAAILGGEIVPGGGTTVVLVTGANVSDAVLARVLSGA